MTGGNLLERGGAALAAGGLQALLLLALLQIGVAGPHKTVTRAVQVFDISHPPEPASPPAPPARSTEPEGAAAPPARRAKPKEVVAPEPEIRLDTQNPLVVAPAASTGGDIRSGAAKRAGPGTGGGGEGFGTGSGRFGTGQGGVPLANRASWKSGAIGTNDYKGAVTRKRQLASVTVHLDITPRGRVKGCRVARSSGLADLDATTCQLIEKRFQFEPARDVSGRAVADVAGWKQDWWLGRR